MVSHPLKQCLVCASEVQFVPLEDHRHSNGLGVSVKSDGLGEEVIRSFCQLLVELLSLVYSDGRTALSATVKREMDPWVDRLDHKLSARIIQSEWCLSHGGS